MIEPLESRIAPAATFVSPTSAFYTDVDGDKVTVVFSKPILNSGNVATVLVTSASGLGDQLQTIDLTGSLAVVPDGTNITLTAVPQDLTPMDTVKIKSGDGLANVGRINATGHPLGTVKISGDLGVIDAGSTVINAVAIQSLTVHSLGELGTTTGAPDLHSDIVGTVKSITVKGNVRNAFVEITGAVNMVDSSLGALTVGGSVLGGSTVAAGTISVVGNVGTVKVGGSLMGGTGSASGQIGSANGSMGAVTIGGDVIGGPDLGFSGYLFAKTTMGAVSIGGDLRGGGSSANGMKAEAGSITTHTGGIASVKIGGSIIGGIGRLSGSINVSSDAGSHGTLGPVTIGGSVFAGAGINSGSILAPGNIASVTIGGDLRGGAGALSGIITSAAGNIGLVKIGGDLRGGGGDDSGRVAGVDLAGVTVRGAMIGGAGKRSAQIAATHSLTSVKIGGSLEGAGDDSAQITSGHNLGAITVGGSLIGGGENSATIGLKDDGDEKQTVGPITVGGSIIGGVGQNSGMIRAFNPDIHDFFGAIKVAGDLRGADNNMTGSVIVGNATSITFGGSILGGTGTNTGYISGLAVGSVSIGHDVRGTDLGGGGTLVANGYLEFTTVGSLTVGGSIVAGSTKGGTTTPKSGLYASQGFGSITIKGSLIGQADNPVTLYAGSLAGDPVENNVVLKSLTIGGRVENAWLFAGVKKDGTVLNGNAQIGAVKVGGDWIASMLGAGFDSVDGFIGDGDDVIIAGGTRSKIASIVIGGAILGRVGATDTFGFVAHEIGSFRYNGLAVVLQKGAGNDTFNFNGTSDAKAVGPSLAPSDFFKPDAFAVHVYEV